MREFDAHAPLPSPVEATAGLPLLVLMTCLLAAAFFSTNYDWRISTYDYYTLAPDDAEALVAAGNSARKVAYTLIGLCGAVLLVRPSRQPRRYASWPLFLLGGYLLTCAASVIWSEDPQLTLKRVGILLFCAVGVMGAVRHLSARNLLDVAVVIAALLIAIGLFAELRLGTFRPLAPGYRFAGTVHPNTQGAYCAMLVLGSFFAIRQQRRGKLLFVVLFVLAGGALLLTKSRTNLAGCLLALSAAWLLGRSRATKTAVAISFPLAVTSLLVAALLCGIELTAGLDAMARWGRPDLESGFEALNGRLPLWNYLLGFVGEKPLLGYGYHGFWSPQRIFEVSIEQEWTIATAHSVFIDVLLGVGLVGGAFLGLGLALAMGRVARRCLTTGDATDGFLFSLVVFALVSACFESSVAQPTSFDAFVIACAVVHAVTAPLPCRRPARQTESRPLPGHPQASVGMV